MTRVLVYPAIAMMACVAALAWPLSPALPGNDGVAGRLTALLTSCAICVAMALSRTLLRGSAFLWLTGTGILLFSAAAFITLNVRAQEQCVATHESKSAIIGRDLQPWVRVTPEDSPDSLLFDAAGVPSRVWTPQSIRHCRFLLGWAALASVPMLTLAGCCLAQAGVRSRVLRPASQPGGVSPHTDALPVFDAFVSYRHAEPDRSFALDILHELENRGFRCAIDVRDFLPNEHFLAEMERCVKQSRYVLCVITSRYVDSDHCAEEAVMSKVLDMSERRRRLVPLLFERVELPLWLHSIVGIDFTEAAAVDPMKKLGELMQHS